jgi:alkaline phosphatase
VWLSILCFYVSVFGRLKVPVSVCRGIDSQPYEGNIFLCRNFRVILGGGMKQFGIPVDPGNDDSCNRTDGRNLLDTWMKGKDNYLFVNNTEDLLNADVSKVRIYCS